ncbi:membrane protein FxsA [Metabacillus litoralis]|uniref:FxsA family protein n=1 Tax=Bacillaceae TaxID=186817 RepID=UPI000BFD8560|nr:MULTISPECIES: FxsA family protein [Bacillaceae]MCM3162855.1 membrane protein FxsA [Metabacillus litoralis]MCM3411021.1 membrane protein FxsA [Metabacillus litoralis]PGT91234.1 membrane protein FxsA [Bacillus sp. AFS040349]UHA62245.1 membrane protein FxsA [Metabacillus litoralis]
MRLLMFLIIVIPALEIGILILSGNAIGPIPTVLLIILTGVVGAWLAKKQGLETLRKAQQDMQFGQIPGMAIIDGLCILIGGVLLLTPGFITDTVGFLLLFPFSRNKFKPILLATIRKMIDKNRITIIR